MNDTNDNLTDGLLGDFLDESADLMRRLNEGLLQLDQAVKSCVGPVVTDQELLNDIFRAAHSLKGLSGMLGFGDINALTHKVENVFDAVRDGRLNVSASVVDVSFQAVDRLDAMIEVLRSAGDTPVACGDLLGRIDDVLGDRPTPSDGASQDSTRSPASNVVATAADQEESLAGIHDDADVPAKYLGIFIDECDLTLDTLADVLLQDPDAGAVEALLIGCHRIKGSAASIGLRRVARLAHLMEDRLQDLRRRDESPSHEIIEALLFSTDTLRGYIGILRSGKSTSDELGSACRRMSLLEAEPSAVAPRKSVAADGRLRHDIDARLRSAMAGLCHGRPGYYGTIQFEPQLPLVELKARLLLDKLHRCGEVFFCHPAEEEFEAVAEFTTLTFGVLSTVDDEKLKTELRVSGVDHVELNALPMQPSTDESPVDDATSMITAAEGSAPPECNASTAHAELVPTAAPQQSGATNESRAKPAETLRVDIERLDQLMNLAGQLVITKARFNQIEQKLKRLFADKSAAVSLAEAVKQVDRLVDELDDRATKPTAAGAVRAGAAKQIRDELGVVQREMTKMSTVRTLLNDLAETVHQFDRVSDGIQKSVMDTRMVPIGPLFSRFKRVVRDLSRSGGKDIQLEISGEHTELDKRMIDELGDPLIHLVRNSADHGIETPELRISAGKPSHGTITLNAFHRGNRIIIKVVDDGRGLDATRIRAKAVAKGWMSQAEAEKLTDAQVHQLIWRPGFSTAERVTEVSGRGMGMDIVLSKIEQLNGSVELSSTPGMGTTFEIKLPLTMAILPSLLMKIGCDTYAVPVESVIEIVRLRTDELTTVYGRRMARVRGRVISLVRLTELFGDSPIPQAGAPADATIVVCGSEGRELGVVVDDLLGEQDVVIKSLAENFRNIDGITGASILGDGRVALILDVGALVEMACSTAFHSQSPTAVGVIGVSSGIQRSSDLITESQV